MEIDEIGDLYHLLSGGVGLGTRPIMSKINFEISPSLKVPCAYWSKVMKTSLPSLKKQVAIAATNHNNNNVVVVKKEEKHILDDDDAAPVKRDTTYRFFSFFFKKNKNIN
jgi:hypothetical protein